MDRRSSLRSGPCNGEGKSSAPSSPVASGSGASAATTAVGSKEDASDERKALLGRQPSGGMARRGQRGSKRRVQWRDTHGKKLAEVLEFQPSDSSDSDDEYLDTCMCSIM